MTTSLYMGYCSGLGTKGTVSSWSTTPPEPLAGEGFILSRLTIEYALLYFSSDSAAAGHHHGGVGFSVGLGGCHCYGWQAPCMIVVHVQIRPGPGTLSESLSAGLTMVLGSWFDNPSLVLVWPSMVATLRTELVRCRGHGTQMK